MTVAFTGGLELRAAERSLATAEIDGKTGFEAQLRRCYCA